jgi:hypothetical protein
MTKDEGRARRILSFLVLRHSSFRIRNPGADSVSIHPMKLLRATLIYAGLMLLGSFAALAQSASFIVSQNGKSVGTASYTFTATPAGYSSESLVKISMQGLDYSLSKTERLDKSNRLAHVLVSGTVNGTAVTIIAKPDAAQLLLNISANGRASTTRLDAHSASVFMADFDPGALQTMLALNVTQQGRGLWAVIPKKTGTVAPVEVATYAPEQGTLDGKPIQVQHLTATFSSERTDIFAGPKNELLQAELPAEGFALVRKGFVLTPPKKPIAPPEGFPQQQQQPVQQQQPQGYPQAAPQE